MPESASTIAVVAEKPSVARDIAKVIGANTKGEGFLHGNGYVVTWAIGHLVALAQPHEIQPEWKHWRANLLPMLPKQWPLVVYEKTKDQFEKVRKIITSPKVGRIVCATDAGREGELIFRYIYEAANSGKPFQRLWISSLTPDAIRRGFAELKDGHEYDGLADAACGRSRADWLVGMNLSRAYTLAYKEELSVGRVQTPTLAMVVERELAIRSFVPEAYREVHATFSPSETRNEKQRPSYRGTWFRPGSKETLQQSMRLPADTRDADEIVARAKTGTAKIQSIEKETKRFSPPQLYDLTELQRHANRLYGFSAQRTLEGAQALYEKHKLISYPRTASRYLSRTVAAGLSGPVKAISPQYAGLIAPGTGERPLSGRYVDDAKITDHHAIIPTAISPAKASLTEDERRLYDLICRRLLQAWHDDFLQDVTTVVTTITNDAVVDHYHSSGLAVRQQGWKVLDIVTEKKVAGEDDAQTLPSNLQQNQAQDVLAAEALLKKTRPPKRFTEATLLTAMETAGKTLDEKELSDAMKETGLGTPATRAAIIEILLKRAYIERQGKSLAATDTGIHLIEVVHPEVKSPAMTGQWESFLKRIERNEAQLSPFLSGIEQYVRDVVGKVAGQARTVAKVLPEGAALPVAAPVVRERARNGSLQDLLRANFGFEQFRANQEAVCRAVVDGKDVLLVMPTGSGKSLCYQLPGLARGGTTLVISPLIALIEDQVAKLKARGFAVDRIHSGRDRGASRQTCIDYLQGNLDFLFVAPERLRVPGFPEMLAKRNPSLIAVDEAHCISQWGHDFRPDYRMLRKHLASLRQAPVIAMTATATPIVQDDIAEQLSLQAGNRFIHGFRRENIAIEVVEVPPNQRFELVRELLDEPEHRPAIVYAPTRKTTDELTSYLRVHFPTAAYHAGLTTNVRQEVQSKFIAGNLEIIVATIAFGMGIDKPDVRMVVHTALPGSIESYYQEIGRAGRDGLPSRAVLMHSYADRHTHDFFQKRDYPEVSVLQDIFGKLSDSPQPKEELQRKVRVDDETFEKALEKLWIHGGALIDYAENVARGTEEWRDPYQAQGAQKLAQLDGMLRFAGTSQCRMTTLVRHFGDLSGARTACGICDFCSPDSCEAQKFRSATSTEREAARQVLQALRTGDGRSTGKVFTESGVDAVLDRDTFEHVLGAMARAGLIRLQDATFQSDGREIHFVKTFLTAEGRSIGPDTEVSLQIKEDRKAKGKATRGRKQSAKSSKRKRAAEPSSEVQKLLKAWRLAEAKKLGVPAFRICSDTTLNAIAAERPADDEELLMIPGVGPKLLSRYGPQILSLIKNA